MTTLQLYPSLTRPRFFVCIPAALAGAAWTWKLESEHLHHLEHIREENGGEMPEIPKYEYLNIR
jgi:cytochrome c oxidase subunit 6a